MKKVCCCALLWLCLQPALVHADGPLRRLIRASAAVVTSGPRLSYEEQRDYLNWRYPKYIGGFHASYYRDLGVPPGDVGFRGNGLYVTPW